MSNNNQKKPNKIIPVLVLIFAVVALVMIAVSYVENYGQGVFTEDGAGVLYVIMIVSAVLLVALVSMTVIFALPKKGSQNRAENRDKVEKVERIDVKDSPRKDENEKKIEMGGKSRFFGLRIIDKNKEGYRRAEYDGQIDLSDLCENFRNFSATRLKLYYSIDDIRRFIAGMAVSRLLILQGMSGTGKTSLAYAFGEYIDNTSTVIPVQPMWKDRSDLIGYYNEFTKKFNETALLKKMYEANYSDDMYITVLDEMNIARAEYYFAEFLSLLELPNPDDRYLAVVTDKMEADPENLKNGLIKLPTNMWFIGTANNDDSTFAISDKVYDRAMILNLDRKSEKFMGKKVRKIRLRAKDFEAMVLNATESYQIASESLEKLKKLDEYLVDNFHVTFGNRIMKQINVYVPVYVACGGREIDALDDIISKKIIRKLETQNPVYIRNSAEGLMGKLSELFGEEEMNICKEHVKVIARNA